MRQTIRWLAVLVVPILLVSGPAVNAQKGKKPDADKDKETANSEKMIKSGVLVGKVAALYEEQRKIRLQVTVPVTEINPGAVNSIQQAQLQMAMARARGDFQGMINAQRQLAQAQLTMYTVRNHNQDVELSATDDVVVRTARPRESFDDKGKIKKFTRAELKELKGPDPKQPGYKAEFSDVQTDQIVQVTLVRKKGAPMKVTPRPRPKKGKDNDADAAADLLGDHLPQIGMILILSDAPASAP